MNTVIIKKYTKILLLLMFFYLNIHFTFSPIGISVRQVQAQNWNDGIALIDSILGTENYNSGVYYNNYDGTWSFCSDCYAQVNLEEVVVYGKKPDSTPIVLTVSDLWHSYMNGNYQSWSYYDYNAGSWVYSTSQLSNTPGSYASKAVATTLSLGDSLIFTHGTVRPITSNTTVFDCSGWVYFVLLQINPTLANSLGQNTSSMQSYISLHGGYHTIPADGDLAVWNSHVEFVVNYDGTHVTINGSRGDDGDQIPTSTGGSYLTPTTMTQIAPNFLGFWTIQE